MSTPQLLSVAHSQPIPYSKLPPVDSGIYNPTMAFGGSVELDPRGWDAIVRSAFVQEQLIEQTWLALAGLAVLGLGVSAVLLWQVVNLRRAVRALTPPR